MVCWRVCFGAPAVLRFGLSFIYHHNSGSIHWVIDSFIANICLLCKIYFKIKFYSKISESIIADTDISSLLNCCIIISGILWLFELPDYGFLAPLSMEVSKRILEWVANPGFFRGSLISRHSYPLHVGRYFTTECKVSAHGTFIHLLLGFWFVSLLFHSWIITSPRQIALLLCLPLFLEKKQP